MEFILKRYRVGEVKQLHSNFWEKEIAMPSQWILSQREWFQGLNQFKSIKTRD